MSEAVLTDGYDCYVRVKRGVYHRVDSRGRCTGMTCSGFDPRPRWRPARRCDGRDRLADAGEAYVITDHGLTCPNCGRYDTHYAMTGERSWCANQGKRPPLPRPDWAPFVWHAGNW